ncbi:hypothetical protein P3T36_000150 [Kitasatospora sp. MAP12-15]|nr:hypothetical protein [Kitasatospora sp. MAP12-44]MDH6109378.1 hypothetical protein [Kitasatospora sp. MAP12-44]
MAGEPFPLVRAGTPPAACCRPDAAERLVDVLLSVVADDRQRPR